MTISIRPVEQAERPRHKTWSAAIATQVLLAVVIWVAHFLDSAQFGLYEDDWFRIPKVVGINWHGLWALIRESSTTPGLSQGRPLHPTLIFLFSFLGFKWGGLRDVYVIAFTILFINAVLFQSFLARVFHDQRFALLGALAFSVFPADTTQAFLTHGLGVQPAIMLLLIAFHCYLTNWKVISYFFIAIVLFNYETPFLVFAAAPLLAQARAKKELRSHCAILTAILIASAVYRSMTGENRMSHLGDRELLLGSMNVVVGPLTCLVMYLYRPMEVLYKMTWQHAGIAMLSTSVFTCIFIAWFLPQELSSRPFESAGTIFHQTKVTNSRKQLLIGVVMLVLAYPLTMTTTGISVAGRGTRVHTAANLGASILCAWACSLLLSRPISRIGKWGTASCVACFFGLLITFGLIVQHDYVLGWKEQREFWTELVALCPSLEDGDVIFVDPSDLPDTRQLLFLRKNLNGIPDTRQIKSLDSLYNVLPAIYEFPRGWKEPPRVFRLPLNWESQIYIKSDELRLLTIEAGYSYDPNSRGPVAASHVIFLDTMNGHLARRSSLQNLRDGYDLKLKDYSETPNGMTKTAFYPNLIYQGASRPEMKSFEVSVQSIPSGVAARRPR